MSDIPHDFVAFVLDWSKAMRFQKQAPDCWIQRVWDGAWLLPKEYSDACVAKVYETADLIMIPVDEPVPVAPETESR